MKLMGLVNVLVLIIITILTFRQAHIHLRFAHFFKLLSCSTPSKYLTIGSIYKLAIRCPLVKEKECINYYNCQGQASVPISFV
jgi:hypothetical protein